MTDDKRKHYTQMTPEETRAMMNAVRSYEYKLAAHALDRMRQKRVSESQIKAMLTYCSIIEAHNNIPSEIRVLVRGKVQGSYCCAVVSLTTKQIVTVYWNAGGDHHATLDRSAYKWTADLTQVRI